MEEGEMSNLGEPNVSLREFKNEDWEYVHEYASQEKACLYQPWGPNSEEDTQTFVSTIVEDAKEKPRTRFALAVVLQESSKVIGTGEISIRNVGNRNGEISYIINPQYWGNGYATEVARQLVQYGFTGLKLHRIYATCDPRNVASSRVLEKIGMKYEGRMRDAMLIRDGWRDSMVYSILENE
jgi:RimJ/RimL family protein N-acetyltransferase